MVLERSHAGSGELLVTGDGRGHGRGGRRWLEGVEDEREAREPGSMEVLEKEGIRTWFLPI